MKVYRYNAKNREDRRYNCTGREKNPNNVQFYATSLEAVKPYKYVYDADGDVDYECELEIREIEANLFDMENNSQNLTTYRKYVDSKIGTMRSDYEFYLNQAIEAKDKKRIKMYKGFIFDLDNEEINLIKILKSENFQGLSDYELQNDLIAELRTLGFEGYITNEEVAIF